MPIFFPAHSPLIHFSFFAVLNILVSTGLPYSSSRKTEIINLKNDGLTIEDCGYYPLEIDGAVGANMGSFPAICGGRESGSSVNQCYKLVAGEWQQFATMTSRRTFAAGMVVDNSLLIFGGYDYTGNVRLQSTEIINGNGEVSTGPNMPTALSRHTIATVNSSTLIISGGFTNAISYSPLTWYYNHVTQKFHEGPALMEGRRFHGSGTVVDQVTNQKIVVVAGGWNGNYLDSTELLITGEWQQGKNHAKMIEMFLLASFFWMCIFSLT